MFVPVDADSELHEVAEIVLPEMIAYMTRRMPRVVLDVVCGDICSLSWSVMHDTGRNAVRARVRAVLEEAARAEFRHYFRWHGGGGGSVAFENNPLDLDPAPRSVAFRSLRRLTRDFVARLREGQLRLDV